MKIATLQTASPLVLIPSIYKSLTKAEQKVADVITADTHEAVYYSVTDLSEKADVGETTVIRFCRKLGYKGYQEFKLAVAQNLVNPNESVYGKIEDTDSIDVIAKKITSQNTGFIQDTLGLMDQNNLEKVAKKLLNARKIYFFGVGSSGITATDAKYRFMRIGFNVDCVVDSHIIAMNAALATEEDVVIGISTSGSTKDLVDAVRIAKENGAFVICLTNHNRSPITKYADEILLAASRETPLQGGSFAAKMAQLHLLDILTTVVLLQQKEQSIQAIEKTAKAVLDKMY
ncbi:MurR/RpiR family transcriptional regulator [Fictibacillus nanhaiensis]|jgi:DNA-binding MurR/RpiR family transcriptional regulator|uniref:MurR/RpiR family transcriptional regulator n=1 Tax=Fictibacillus nanhaiensis TaxID=742169 RepID=UPI00203E5A41|nr:MurR/RpiR family transcriptional regulator [Fictibacillus nanhaiensis]MCM3733471.1 MurR/RpiR family transcriptional regulator [Fictibacillus nanhaiensis]